LPGFGDNGFGGCVVQVAAVGCSFPYFSQQGSCVSTCNAGSYPNIDTRVCEACSSNCFSCFSSAFCTSCRSGFDLNSNICITGQKCASNRLKYNGVCLESCPVGTIASNGYCERRCVPNSYFLNNRCYTTCPTGSNIRTEAACVTQCPTGYILNGSVCKLSINTCASGLFYNAQTGSCTACASSCTECQFTSSYCTACASGLSLISNKCAESNNCGSGRFKTASGSCTNCPTKCLDCVSATECATCASNFVFNGADCVLKLTNWKEI
jgi:proprotein convertase subtilisin/kexin type 5